MILPDEKISLTRVLKQTVTSLMYPQVILLFIIPMLASALFIFGAFWLSWDFLSGLWHDGVVAFNPWWQNAVSHLPVFVGEILTGLGPITTFLLFLLLFAIGFPLVIVLNLAATSILASTFLVHFLAKKDFAELEKKESPRVISGAWNAISSGVLFLFFWLITLPLWLIPGAQIILPTVLTAWFNRRVCLFDALAEYASDEEMETIKVQYSGQSFLLGMMTSIFNYLPFALVFSPVLSMVSFVYFGLTALRRLRAA